MPAQTSGNAAGNPSGNRSAREVLSAVIVAAMAPEALTTRLNSLRAKYPAALIEHQQSPTAYIAVCRPTRSSVIVHCGLTIGELAHKLAQDDACK
jgi:hypothetical protein